jgi:hypothetical protein
MLQLPSGTQFRQRSSQYSAADFSLFRDASAARK